MQEIGIVSSGTISLLSTLNVNHNSGSALNFRNNYFCLVAAKLVSLRQYELTNGMLVKLAFPGDTPVEHAVIDKPRSERGEIATEPGNALLT